MNDKITTNPYNEMALKMMNSRDLIELTDYLQGFLYYIESLKNKKEAFDEIVEIIKPYYERYTVNKEKSSHIILKGKKSIICFLWLVWPHIGSSEERFEALDAQCNAIRLTIRKPLLKERLEPDTIDELMRKVEDKYSFGFKILRGHCLKILLIDNSHGLFNSFVISQMLPSGRLDDAIVIPCIKPDFPCSQMLSLVHELGHILHLRLTGETITPPENFRLIQEIMFYASIGFPGEKLCEIFADCFAFAAVRNSPLENESVLKDIHENDKKILEMYFRELFDSIEA